MTMSGTHTKAMFNKLTKHKFIQLLMKTKGLTNC